MLVVVLGVLVTLCQARLTQQEREYSADTQLCRDTATQTHGDPNASLDIFVNCLLKQLSQVRSLSVKNIHVLIYSYEFSVARKQ